MSGTVRAESTAGVAVIELDNPRKRHALTREMFTRLVDLLHAADVDEQVRVVLIRSDGPIFCSGLDLDELVASHEGITTDAVADLNRMLDTSAAVCGAIAESRKPVIVAAQGPCIGIGTLMFLSCDIGLMTPGARLQLPKALLGAGYFAPLLGKLLGPRRAKSLLLSPEVFAIEAAEAQQWGLAAAVLPPAGFREEAQAYAEGLARVPAGWLQLQKAGVDSPAAALSVREAIRAGAQLDALAHSTGFARKAAQDAFGRTAEAPDAAMADGEGA